MTIVMGLDQHRAQITAEWLDTDTGEISRARVAPADRAGVRRFLRRFRGGALEVALEATTGWRFVVEESNCHAQTVNVPCLQDLRVLVRAFQALKAHLVFRHCSASTSAAEPCSRPRSTARGSL